MRVMNSRAPIAAPEAQLRNGSNLRIAHAPRSLRAQRDAIKKRLNRKLAGALIGFPEGNRPMNIIKEF
jgi:hypothetical protein